MKEMMLGIMASMFFAVTFILNRSMELSGGSWLWSSSLRFLFMVPFLVLIVMVRRNMKQVLSEMWKNPLPWLLWSFVGFVLFYAPITYAAAYGPGWLVAGTWQLTIVAGTLLGPLFMKEVITNSGAVKVRQKIPFRSLFISLFILCGVILIQIPNAEGMSVNMIMSGIIPVVIAAFCYPLGNRKMMEVVDGRLDTFQRVFGMTIATVPIWLLIASAGFIDAGLPSSSQVLQSLIVAISSGIVATILFFIATDMVRNHHGKLASVEATQSTQVLFVMAGEILIFSAPLPAASALFGVGVIVIGMVLHSLNQAGMGKLRSMNEAAGSDDTRQSLPFQK
ncbi:multidrug resistance efflux transporter family protein [[Bacillus] enclensis]|uniref:DMT family transporter n=1 Tax=[Bacillus] enclensis TaxID=1402860 RepID=UPI0018DD5F5A|nr:multidrug resistance efflux transporter family protein [[Bacillus] enclensis]MBH9965289.1 multidrug resistance efflux transporter family protein [[Bacillus] enclensis]